MQEITIHVCNGKCKNSDKKVNNKKESEMTKDTVHQACQEINYNSPK